MIKHLALVEADRVTGAAKNVIDFCRSAREAQADAAHDWQVHPSLVTFQRANAQQSTLAAFQSSNEFVAAARSAGIAVDVIRERFRFDTRVIGQLQQVAQRYAPDILETHHVKSHFLMRQSGLWRQRPWVAFHHGYTTTDLKMRAYNRLDRWSLRAADCIVTMNQSFARQLERSGVPAERIQVLHNAVSANWNEKVPNERVRALRAELHIAADERVILAVGRLSQEKGHADLVAAFALLRRTYPTIKARLVIVGEGPEQAAIQHASAGLGTIGQVVLTGHQSDVSAYYALADVLALPSHSEGSPFVLLEAMAAGLPVVATDVGGIPEIVAHQKSALLVEARQPRAMADALALVLGSDALARDLTAQARAVLIERHTPEAYLRSRTAIYRQLLDRAPGHEASGELIYGS